MLHMIPPDNDALKTPEDASTDPRDGMALKPGFVLEQWKITEARRRRQRKAMRRNKMAYESQMWRSESNDDSITHSQDEGPVTASGSQIVVEVSRMPTIIQTYTGYLFPRSPRTIFSPDIDGRGDPTLAQLAADRWFASRRLHKKITNAIGQSLLYRGCALKLGIDLTKTLPQDRVWAKVVPWWDLVLDWDVQDEEEARFIGHSYWEDRAVLEKRFGPLPEDIHPEQRNIYFEHSSRYGETRRMYDSSGTSDRFIHVLEWYNLVDDFVTEDGDTIRGVFEVYFIEQLTKCQKPFLRKAIPFSYADGEPCVPLFPLIFDSVKEHPLQGIALADRVYPQCYEMALLRTSQANALRRDARCALIDKNSGINQDDLGKITKGEDGAMVLVEKQDGKPWTEVIHPFQFPSINQDHQVYEAAVERDLSQGANTPKFTRGEAMGSRTTAYEVKQLNSYMENRFGELARIKDSWIADVARGFIRIIMQAMKAPGVLDGSKHVDDLTYVVGPKKEVTRITIDDLDGDFEIGIVDAASTPMTREARRQDIMLLLPNLLQLWEKAKAGDAMASTLLDSLVDLYDLPANFGHKHLLELQKQMEEDAKEAAPPPQPGVGGEELSPERKAKALALLQQTMGGQPQEATEPPMGATPPGA